MLNAIITPQTQNDMQKLMPATIGMGYLLWYLIMAQRGNVNDRVIMFAAV
jgi:hypothetical protein